MGHIFNLIAKLLLFGGVVDDPEEMPIREGEEDFAKRHRGLGMIGKLRTIVKDVKKSP
jgi:hypothetical protein